MDPLILIAIYIFIWWTSLFAVLPFGVRTQQEEGSVVPGTPESAPAQTPRVLRIIAINTVVATVIFAIVFVVIKLRLITADTFPFP
jgi:predicted secreted protein